MNWSAENSVEAYLEHIPNFKSVGEKSANFDLSRFRSFCSSIGNPQQELNAVHIGGTNGKGSSCRILSNILQEAGYRVGLYTSPHMIDYAERFQVNSRKIPEEALIHFFDEYASFVEAFELTYFEICTAISFWWFRESEADIAVIEVGLGGRLDATNVINPILSAITSIALDHTNILGDTIEDVAREKAGIIKAERPVVLGDLAEEAKAVIDEIASQKNSPVVEVDAQQCIYSSSGEYILSINDDSLQLSSGLRAPVQRKNIAMAWQILRQIEDRYPTTTDHFVTGIAETESVMGRFERLSPNQQWYFDGAHNLEAVHALKEFVATVRSVPEAVLVFSIMEDKMTPEVARELSEFKKIYYYGLGLERAASFDDISQLLPCAYSFPNSRIQELLSDKLKSELVIFAGSFYFYSTVREWLKNLD